MVTYLLADAQGGANAAAANSVASMQTDVARLEFKINNMEEEINDVEEEINSNDNAHLDAALKSKRQELASSKAQLKAEKEKLAKAQKAGEDEMGTYLLAGANAAAANSVASMQKNVAELEDKIEHCHRMSHWINDHLPESEQNSAWSANTKELDHYEAKLKAEKKKLANAQKTAAEDMVTYLLADATGGANAAAAISVASIEKNMADLEDKIKHLNGMAHLITVVLFFSATSRSLQTFRIPCSYPMFIFHVSYFRPNFGSVS